MVPRHIGKPHASKLLPQPLLDLDGHQSQIQQLVVQVQCIKLRRALREPLPKGGAELCVRQVGFRENHHQSLHRSGIGIEFVVGGTDVGIEQPAHLIVELRGITIWNAHDEQHSVGMRHEKTGTGDLRGIVEYLPGGIVVPHKCVVKYGELMVMHQGRIREIGGGAFWQVAFFEQGYLLVDDAVGEVVEAAEIVAVPEIGEALQRAEERCQVHGLAMAREADHAHHGAQHTIRLQEGLGNVGLAIGAFRDLGLGITTEGFHALQAVGAS